MSLWKIAGIVGACAGVTIALAMANIWLGILALPICYGICEAWLFDQ